MIGGLLEATQPGGGGFSDSAAINGLPVTNAGLKGGFAGLTLGNNYQIGQFVIGIEDDFAGSFIGKTWSFGFYGSIQDQILAFGTLTGRFGFAANNVLIYGKGGYTYMLNEISASGLGGSAWERQFHNGWTIGGGLEYVIGSNSTIKIEYQHFDFDNNNFSCCSGASGRIENAVTADSVKIGVNFLVRALRSPIY